MILYSSSVLLLYVAENVRTQVSKILRRESGRHGNILSDYRQNGNVAIGEIGKLAR